MNFPLKNSFFQIAFITNNNTDVTRPNGGSHWSLLLFDRPSDTFIHFDSSSRYNHQTAEILAKKSKKLVKQRKIGTEIVAARCLQQRNSTDCGLYVANFLSVLMEKRDIKSVESMKKIEKTRSFWRDLILNFE
ncbi:CRE-ULP-3 protein [Caenorhabditis remanei]|uniref:CRE-ULP-3 protein n=1 Tax=Caenorhabditis remanei TaxID=31234 RepID=E3NDC1_CAERE|nr:CRE-ULP-3 protein [Caenorhabditis remanei]